MTASEFAQRLQENIGSSTFSVMEVLRQVKPSETILLSYELYNKLLYHTTFAMEYSKYVSCVDGHISTIIPGRVMLLKTGHLIVVI